LVQFIGGIAARVRSVVCRLLHLCTSLKQLHGFRFYLAGTCVWFKDSFLTNPQPKHAVVFDLKKKDDTGWQYQLVILHFAQLLWSITSVFISETLVLVWTWHGSVLFL